MADDYDEKYTDPDLRREIKDELMDSDKGGDPGQWSARKSQMLVQEYEKRGGGYKKDSKDEDAKSLEEWTDQDWQTKDGSAYASEDGETKRYLPKRAWDLLSEAERDRTDRKKREEGEDAAQQYVANTIEAKAARAYVDHGDASELFEDQLKRLNKGELDDLASDAEIDGRSKMDKDDLAAALRNHYDNAGLDDGGSGGVGDRTKAELYEEAKGQDVDGRSKMDKGGTGRGRGRVTRARRRR